MSSKESKESCSIELAGRPERKVLPRMLIRSSRFLRVGNESDFWNKINLVRIFQKNTSGFARLVKFGILVAFYWTWVGIWKDFGRILDKDYVGFERIQVVFGHIIVESGQRLDRLCTDLCQNLVIVQSHLNLKLTVFWSNLERIYVRFPS